MNIIFAANDYTEHGGFHSYLIRVTKALNGMGHKAVIVKCGEKNAHTYDNGVEVWETAVHYYKCKYQWINMIINNIKASICVNRKINEMAKSQKIDIIQFTSLKSVALLYFGKAPAVMRLSSYAKKCYSTDESFSKNTVNVMSAFEVMAGKHCNAVFAPSRATADAFEKDFHKKVYVIETPFINDVEQFDDQIVNQHLRGKKYVLFFGAMFYVKGILTIADIIERFLEQNPDYFFVFAGKALSINGKNAAKIVADGAGKHKDRVVFLGPLPHTQLYPVIQHADFVVLPSIMENFSNACIEAMYFSKVVIGTNGASFDQLIDHGVSGLLCRIADSEDLLEKMQEAVNLPQKKKQQMELLAHKRIDRLRPEIAVKRLVRFYENVINNSGQKNLF